MKLLRVFTWLWATYAVLVNVVTFAGPWAQLAEWYSPSNFQNWRDEFGLVAPPIASYFLAQWLSARA